MRGSTAEASMESVAGAARIRLLYEAGEELLEDRGQVGCRHVAREASMASASFTSRAVTPPASWLHSVSVTSE